MKYVIDIECNGLVNPDRIWLVVMKNIDTDEYHYFYDLTKKDLERERFIRLIDEISRISGVLIGHNLLGYDWPILCSLLKIHLPSILLSCVDTLIISKLVDF